MVKVEEMTYSEKFSAMLSYIKLVEEFAPRLVTEELGKEKTEELRGIWERELQSIPKDASSKDKYEIAFRNFMQKWVTANNFMVEHQGEAGIKEFMYEAIEAWKRKYSRSALIFRIVSSVSSKMAFQRLAERLAFQLQAFSPFVVSELDEKHMTLTVAPCNILQTRGKTDFCIMACQNIIPSWLRSQFNIKMKSERQGANCIVTFTPF